MTRCETCKHEMTESGENSSAHKVGVCFMCLPFVSIDMKRNHTQADHDDDGVCGGFMTEKEWEKRNQDRKFNEVFQKA